MKKYRIIAVIMSTCMMFLASGCQLAKKESETEQTSDRLIGVFVTKEPIDIEQFTAKDSNANNHLCAELFSEEHPAEDDESEVYTSLEYKFEGVKGVRFFTALHQMPDPMDNYISTATDDVVDIQTNALHVSDEAETTTIEGTIYVSSNSGEQVYYINTVYQTGDGRVYVVAGSGLMLSGGKSEGLSCSQKYDETTTANVDGRNKSFTTSVEISLSTMTPPQQIVVLEMDQNNKVLSRNQYEPGMLPKKLSLTKDTQYLIVESHKQNNEAIQSVSRTIYGKEDESMETFYENADGYCIKQYTQLQWAE